MGSSCCKSSEKDDDKPPLPALEIAPKESGHVDTLNLDPVHTTDHNVSASLSVSINPPLETPKLVESSGKSLKQGEMEKSARDSKSSLKIRRKESGPIDSADIPNRTETETGLNSNMKVPIQSPSEIPKLTESSGKSLKAPKGGISKKGIAKMGGTIVCANCLDPLDTTEEDTKRKSLITTDSISQALSKFATDLYSKIESGANLVFSPISITLAMALLEQGASGKAREEILKLISPNLTTSGISDIVDCGQLYGSLQEKILQFPKEHGQLCIANSVFLDIDYSVAIRESYLQNVRKCFKNETINAPFWKKTENARQQVNGWISEKTMGKIPELFGPDSLEKDTVVLLVNAIYMKVDWERKFNVARTKEGTFYRGLGLGEQKAKFMCGDGGPYMGRKDFHAVELPYKGGTMGMYIILPRDRDGIKELEKKINADFLMDVFASTCRRIEVRMEIPKFTMRFKTSLLPALDKMGFRTLDELERMFDRSRIPDNRRIEIKDIVHEAFIEVDEEGTVAAAVTVIAGKKQVCFMRPPPFVTFVADHPFLFVIVHKPTWSVMFMGKVESVEKE